MKLLSNSPVENKSYSHLNLKNPRNTFINIERKVTLDSHSQCYCAHFVPSPERHVKQQNYPKATYIFLWIKSKAEQNIITMDAGTWYRSLPRFTRYWITATVGLSLLCRFEIIPLHWLHLDRSLVLGKLQLWRCMTSLFVFPISPNTAFHFLINCYFIVQYSSKLEKDQYNRSPADYLYLLIIAAVLANLGGLLFNVYFLMDMLVMAITYIWCQLNKDVTVTFWFGTRFKAMYLPWVLAGFEFIFKL